MDTVFPPGFFRARRSRRGVMLWLGCGLLAGLLAGLGMGVAAGAEKAAPRAKPKAGPPAATNAPLSRPAPRPGKLLPGEDLFHTNQGVLRIRLELEKAALESLRRDPRKHVRAQVIEGQTVYRDVAVHLKGAAGSFRGVDDKPALTLTFDRFTPSQRFYGLRKIHLNNSVQDNSYLAEHICGEMFRAAGVPATRAAHAVVELNGRKLGFYVLKEGFTKDFLSLHFKNNSGNLYDGGFVKEITEPLEKDTGDGPNDHSDLKALVAAAQERDPDRRWERLCQTLDVERFIAYMVVENMTWDWDGYPMNRNNYRIYHDPETGRMVFFPHGTDQMFSQPEGPLMSPLQGMLAQALMRTGEGRRLYRQRYSELFPVVYQAAALTNEMAQLEARIKQSLGKEYEHHARELAGPARDLRQRIMARARHIERQLQEPPSAALRFSQGQTVVRNWQRQEAGPAGVLEQKPDPRGTNALAITLAKPGTASWRARVTLPAGQYVFSAEVVTAALQAGTNAPPAGAGLRASADPRHPRAYTRDAARGKILECPLEVRAPFEELELICELRQAAGQAWFNVDSLRLRQVP